ncbi:hypothetical protein [Nocardia wallacei]|uniref:hypothetical protein n=1 Tax=Nocardia wallacei TaxID=480035 RepID=UPI003CC801C2
MVVDPTASCPPDPVSRAFDQGRPDEWVPRARNYDSVRDLVAERVAKSQGRISAERLLPAAQAAGYEGAPRNFRRLVADQKGVVAQGSSSGRRPAVWSLGE